MVSQVGSVVLPATDEVAATVLASVDHTPVGRWLLGLVAPVASLGSKRAGGTSARHYPTVYLQQNILILAALF